MSDLDFLDLSRQFSALRAAVRQNLVRCDTRFAQSLHEKLLVALNGHLKTSREGARVQRRLRTETDPAAREVLEQTLGDCMGDLESGGRGFYPWHLLDAVDRDPDFSGYRHPVAATWCHGTIPEWMTVGDEHLCGLGPILRRIAARTGIRFTTYLCDASIGPEGAGHLDPEIYERPISNFRYR
ncbi:hypothetical protein [Paracoccus sp. FO-3]|uniref:hypothetical protein n=1 Tax=Paracoccus sp. FO-3 TaxID=1335059 RepID=UPI00112D9C3C|nr:hypothetical protein [Paracoccus sp. FO-3]